MQTGTTESLSNGHPNADHRITDYRGAIEWLPSPGVLEYRILGPLEVVDERGPVRLGGPKQRATLSILLLSRNRVVSVERLADDLYAGAPPATAVTQVQRQISQLRKLLGPSSCIETRAPGYVIRLAPGQLDLDGFERRVDEAGEALVGGDTDRAAGLFRQALGLWRGAPLDDLAYEQFARRPIERLEEIRLAVLEEAIEAELSVGLHGNVIAELETLVAEHPLRERFARQLMLALYRSGRQAEALDVYRLTREALVGTLGIEPTPILRDLERAILEQDLSLELDRGSNETRRLDSARAVLVLPSRDDRVDDLLALAAALAKHPPRELILARLTVDETELERAVSALSSRRETLGVTSRTAAFTSLDRPADAVRLAAIHEVDLVLLDAPADVYADDLPAEAAALLERSPADVALLTGPALQLARGAGVFVPFGGGPHDWAALELAAWLASAVAAPLRLVGRRADLRRGERDASRLLADASLAVQRVVGIEAAPLLVNPSDEALGDAVGAATLVVMGISPRWRREGIGTARRALVRRASSPVLLVHGGPRPGGLAPHESRSRFTWSMAPQ